MVGYLEVVFQQPLTKIIDEYSRIIYTIINYLFTSPEIK